MFIIRCIRLQINPTVFGYRSAKSDHLDRILRRIRTVISNLPFWNLKVLPPRDHGEESNFASEIRFLGLQNEHLQGWRIVDWKSPTDLGLKKLWKSSIEDSSSDRIRYAVCSLTPTNCGASRGWRRASFQSVSDLKFCVEKRSEEVSEKDSSVLMRLPLCFYLLRTFFASQKLIYIFSSFESPESSCHSKFESQTF